MKNLLYSAIIGDICGSVYEFRPTRNYDKINLTDSRSFFTDDTVCTIAVADALMSGKPWLTPHWNGATAIRQATMAQCSTNG